jgi:hypothetical protein
LKRWWNTTTELSLSVNAQDIDLVQSPEFKTYTLAGKHAGSIIYRINLDGKTHDVLQVGRILNNGDLVLTLGTLKQSFNQQLPQMEHIIKSQFTTDRYR